MQENINDELIVIALQTAEGDRFCKPIYLHVPNSSVFWIQKAIVKVTGKSVRISYPENTDPSQLPEDGGSILFYDPFLDS